MGRFFFVDTHGCAYFFNDNTRNHAYFVSGRIRTTVHIYIKFVYLRITLQTNITETQ